MLKQTQNNARLKQTYGFDIVGRMFKMGGIFHVWAGLLIVLAMSLVISAQINNRSTFANCELHDEVARRWGAPISQAAPTVLAVPSGTVFTELSPLVPADQEVIITAAMNYRKRGLVFFSGFEFSFSGSYLIRNENGFDQDLAFIFPIALEKNKVLLSDLNFSINGEPTRIDLVDEGDKLLWTGRLEQGQETRFTITYTGRGLDSFIYRLNPDLPVYNFRLLVTITGGDNFDYPAGVLSAPAPIIENERIKLAWAYDSLESGVPLGVILPSEKSFDTIITIMVRRTYIPFLLFLSGLIILWLRADKKPRIYESCLIACGYGFFYVLLAYLAAFMHFYLAYLLSLSIISILLVFYLYRIISTDSMPYVIGLLLAFLFIPTLAVILQGYTGLIYCLEILAGLMGLMFLTTKASFREGLDQTLLPTPRTEGGQA